MDTFLSDALDYLKMLNIIHRLGFEPFDETQWATNLLLEFDPAQMPDMTLEKLKTPEGFLNFLEREDLTYLTERAWFRGQSLLDFLVEGDILKKKKMTFKELSVISSFYKNIFADALINEALSSRKVDVYFADLDEILAAKSSLIDFVKNELSKTLMPNNQQWSLTS
jgi:hypothetical protein